MKSAGVGSLLSAIWIMILAPGAMACGDVPPYELVIEPTYEKVQYRYTSGQFNLSQMAHKHAVSGPHGAVDKPVGLAVSKLYVSVYWEMKYTGKQRDGLICAIPQKVVVEYGFKDNTVYVAREIPRYSCIHDIVLGHENKHVRVERDLVDEYRPVLAEYFERAIENLGIVRMKSRNEAHQAIEDYFRNTREKVYDHMNEVRKNRQMEIDTAEEYERVSRSCDGEIYRYIRPDGKGYFRF